MISSSRYLNKTFAQQMVISENGNLPEKQGHIEIYDCASYLLWVRTQVSGS